MNAKIICTAVIAAACIGSFGSVAQAQTASTSFHTSELGSVSGQRVVLRRIQIAAKNACEGGRGLAEVRASKACAAQLTETMVASAHSPVLTTLWSGKSDTQFAANAR